MKEKKKNEIPNEAKNESHKNIQERVPWGIFDGDDFWERTLGFAPEKLKRK